MEAGVKKRSVSVKRMKFDVLAAAHSNAVQTQNRLGEYVSAIPEPFFYGFGYRCGCGKFFVRYDIYRGHYALEHILQLD
jgi:hypothetical protein